MPSTSREEGIVAWLAKKRLTCILLRGLGAVALLGIGIVALFITFWSAYGVCWFTMRSFGLSSSIYAIISAVFLLLLFVGNARTDREYLEEISVTTGTVSDEVVTLYVPGVGFASNINPLAPDTLHSGVKMITTLLYSGPRAVVAALRLFRKAYRLLRLDVRRGGAVIAFLYAHPGRVPFDDLLRHLPGLNFLRVLPPLRDVDAVNFLGGDPAGLMLNSQSRAELDRSVA
jgi:hypothetical protein